MPETKIRRALISVYDKTGIVDFARALHDEFGIEIISTGGTAKILREAGIPVTLVEDITGFPEMLDGRVKTLHPKIHAAILADRDNPAHMRQLAEQGIEPLDMVVVNLYPFEKTIAKPDCTFEEAIEMIDIGGPCLLRAAGKNQKHVLVVSDPAFYDFVVERLRQWQDTSARDDLLSSGGFGAFWQTCGYDGKVAQWLSNRDEDGSPIFSAERFFSWRSTRYGENPHQGGRLLQRFGGHSEFDLTTADANFIDKEEVSFNQDALSFNNYADASAALELCAELTRAGTVPTACFIKHTNACGTALAAPHSENPDDVLAAQIDAYARAYLGDPNAAMGGVLAVNFEVTADFAAAVMETYQRWGKPLKDAGQPYAPGAFFIEVWLAPRFTQDAVAIIRGQYAAETAKPEPGEARIDAPPQKDWGKRVRLLDVGDMSVEPDANEMDFKRIAGGVLMQTRDLVGLNEAQWKVVTQRQPTEAEINDLRLAWLICKHTKSNAITICGNGMLLGNGAGQMSRVMSCRIATWLAKENSHEDKLRGAVAASDAFFPFRDGPDVLIDAGVTALIQPGGSKRDEEVIAACNEGGVAMVFTGMRHFRH